MKQLLRLQVPVEQATNVWLWQVKHAVFLMAR